MADALKLFFILALALTLTAQTRTELVLDSAADVGNTATVKEIQ